VCVVSTATWPRIGHCDRCDEPIIFARHPGAGRPIPLDEIELLPRGRCGLCRGTGHVGVQLAVVAGQGMRTGSQEIGADAGKRQAKYTAVDCYACKGSGIRGEDITTDVLILDARHGIARRSDGSPRWQSWESFHRPHRCGR
jgi:hypothetical protein